MINESERGGKCGGGGNPTLPPIYIERERGGERRVGECSNWYDLRSTNMPCKQPTDVESSDFVAEINQHRIKRIIVYG